jgi:hypothetical protein
MDETWSPIVDVSEMPEAPKLPVKLPLQLRKKLSIVFDPSDAPARCPSLEITSTSTSNSDSDSDETTTTSLNRLQENNRSSSEVEDLEKQKLCRIESICLDNNDIEISVDGSAPIAPRRVKLSRRHLTNKLPIIKPAPTDFNSIQTDPITLGLCLNFLLQQQITIFF